MTNNDWLDEIFAGWSCFYRIDKIVDFESRTLKQQILGHIAEKYVTKQECEKRVLEAEKEFAEFLLNEDNVKIIKSLNGSISAYLEKRVELAMQQLNTV